jgi:uncharacterized membrane protein
VLTEQQKQAIVARVAALERATGVQVVTAVTPRASAYRELPWTAFALAAALAGLAVVALDRLRPSWPGADDVLVAIALVLLAGGASALCAAFVPAYARLLLRVPQRDAEVSRHARLTFHEHGLASTRARNGVLILVARFERKVELVADSGFDGRIRPDDWRNVVAAATGALRDGSVAAALLAALDQLDAVLRGGGFASGGGGNELPDAPLELAST